MVVASPKQIEHVFDFEDIEEVDDIQKVNIETFGYNLFKKHDKKLTN